MDKKKTRKIRVLHYNTTYKVSYPKIEYDRKTNRNVLMRSVIRLLMCSIVLCVQGEREIRRSKQGYCIEEHLKSKKSKIYNSNGGRTTREEKEKVCNIIAGI